MSGDIPGAVTMDNLSPSGDGAWGQRDGSRSVDSPRPGGDEISVVPRRSRRASFLPDIPRLPTLRSRVADYAFVLLLLLSRCSLLIGAVVGGMLAGFYGAVLGLAGGWIVGVWMRWSLGLRRRRLTHGLVVRMLERGNNDRPKLLESAVETLRGHRLSAKQCRVIAAAYGMATRRLQASNSPSDRDEILQERDRRILAAVSELRERPLPALPVREPAIYRENFPAPHRSGKRAVRKCCSERDEGR